MLKVAGDPRDVGVRLGRETVQVAVLAPEDAGAPRRPP
jgi:hypothetical protein